MDPFEEFEFKPLTDGLGFHKKKTSTPQNHSDDSLLFKSTSLADQGLELIEESAVDPLRPPLPRKKINPQPSLEASTSDSSQAVNEILKTLQSNKHLEFNAKAKNTPVKDEFKKTTWSFSAVLLDSMLVVAASLLCMIILLLVTKVDLIGNLKNPDSQGMIYLATLAIFAGVSFIYLTMNRIFLGYTPGEWAFDQRVGLPEDLDKATFSLKVLVRAVFVIATGFVLLPIISVLFNKDIAGSLSGAKLYKKA
ncbi:putative metalloendopeptidase [Bdellovibrio bacteriovorus W]|nr:putative metalloendopeptidase [Bdellovibrio bacteriovorus W]